MSAKRFHSGWPALLALSALLPLLCGCGLGTVGIILGVMMSSEGDEEVEHPAVPGPQILFEEDFETDLSNWALAGDAVPILDAAGGEFAQGLDPVGTTTGNGEAVTVKAFNLDPGLSVSGHLHMPSLGTANADIWFGLKDGFAADGVLDLLCGFFLVGAQSQAKMYVGDTVVHTMAIADTDYHRYQMSVRTDGKVEFYVDGALVHISTEVVDPRADYRPVTVGGRSSGAAVRADTLEVFGYLPVRNIKFADAFGGDLSNWVTAGSTWDPTIDSFLTGAPSPSLNPQGSSSAGSEALTVDTFQILPDGLEIRADLYISTLGTDDIRAWVGLAHGTGPGNSPALAAGAVLRGDIGGSDAIDYYVNNTIVASESISSPGWYRFRIVIRPDPLNNGFVEFHRNGQLVRVDTNDLDPGYENHALVVGGQNHGGTARIDNAAVLSPPAVQAPFWRTTSEAGTGPSTEIEGHLCIWDRVNHRGLVLFGGSGGAASTSVYELSVSGTQVTWTTLSPSGTAPAPKTYAAGVYSPSHKSVFVVMGSGDASGTSLHQDVWQLDFSTSTSGAWTQLASSWGTGPTARYGHSVVIDSAGQDLILFGGRDGTGLSDETWAFDIAGTTWTSVSPTGAPPTARAFHGAIYDRASNRMVVVGGEDDTGTALADSLYHLDLSTSAPTWVALTPSGATVAPRSRAALAVDTLRRRMYMLGGVSNSTYYSECRTFDLAGGGDGIWSADILSIGDAPPGCDAGGGLIYVPALQRLVAIGGLGASQTATVAEIEEE